jgi:hypothetical protein
MWLMNNLCEKVFNDLIKDSASMNQAIKDIPDTKIRIKLQEYYAVNR